MSIRTAPLSFTKSEQTHLKNGRRCLCRDERRRLMTKTERTISFQTEISQSKTQELQIATNHLHFLRKHIYIHIIISTHQKHIFQTTLYEAKS
jgi:hypothetical protein